MQPTTRFPLRARTLASGLVLLTLLGMSLGTPTYAESDENAPNPPNAPNPASVSAPEGKDLDAFWDAATSYLDLEEDLYVGRLAFVEAIEKETKRGFDFLGDLPFLRETIYQCRYFYPQMDDKRWREDEGINTYKSKSQWHHLKSEEVHLAFSLPKKYPKKNKVFLKRPRIAPLPLLVSTIQRQDYTGQDFPGFTLMKRRFPKDLAGDLMTKGAILVPIAPAGKYITKEGRLMGEWVTYQITTFFKHYHIDYDRVVLDGGPEVLLAATSQPLLYAGFILRTRETLTDEMKGLIQNFASVPIFVQDCPNTTKQLQEAGHPNVTNGSAADIPAWVAERKRKAPTKFSWRLSGPQHQFAYWINVEQVNWAAPDRTLEVEVIDTEEHPNTIKIDAIGVRELSLYLNDDIVDLSRNVRVVVNGHLEVDEKLERSVDITFNRDPLKIRESLYYGLLFPARLNRITVRAPAKKPDAGSEGADVKGSPEDEARAEKLMSVAKKYIANGSPDAMKGAVKRLEAIIKIGETSYKAEAEKLLADLKAK